MSHTQVAVESSTGVGIRRVQAGEEGGLQLVTLIVVESSHHQRRRRFPGTSQRPCAVRCPSPSLAMVGRLYTVEHIVTAIARPGLDRRPGPVDHISPDTHRKRCRHCHPSSSVAGVASAIPVHVGAVIVDIVEAAWAIVISHRKHLAVEVAIRAPSVADPAMRRTVVGAIQHRRRCHRRRCPALQVRIGVSVEAVRWLYPEDGRPRSHHMRPRRDPDTVPVNQGERLVAPVGALRRRRSSRIPLRRTGRQSSKSGAVVAAGRVGSSTEQSSHSVAVQVLAQRRVERVALSLPSTRRHRPSSSPITSVAQAVAVGVHAVIRRCPAGCVERAIVAAIAVSVVTPRRVDRVATSKSRRRWCRCRSSLSTRVADQEVAIGIQRRREPGPSGSERRCTLRGLVQALDVAVAIARPGSLVSHDAICHHCPGPSLGRVRRLDDGAIIAAVGIEVLAERSAVQRRDCRRHRRTPVVIVIGIQGHRKLPGRRRRVRPGSDAGFERVPRAVKQWVVSSTSGNSRHPSSFAVQPASQMPLALLSGAVIGRIRRPALGAIVSRCRRRGS